VKARDHPNVPFKVNTWGHAGQRAEIETKKKMGDRSAISTPKDTLGKASRACDNARNVKNFGERAVNGNALPLTYAGMPA